MSDDGFHVHGPHDHELEHVGQHSNPAQAGRLAVATAVLATIGAIFGYIGWATQANAILYKNSANIKKTEASNQWAYYQSKGQKQNIAEAIVLLSQDLKIKEEKQKEVDRYKKEKEEIKVKADVIEEEAKSFDEKSDHQMHIHHRIAQATTSLQVAIALAAIALLTKKKWLEYGMFGVASLGCVIGASAYFI